MEDYKYLAIVDWVKKYIADEHLKADDRFLTEKELCAIHNVSRQTVRQALMKLESDNIIKRVRGSGTFVSGGNQPRPVVTGNVGVVSTYFSDYIFPHIITGIEGVLNDAGCPIQLAITHNLVSEETQALKSMLTNGVRGLIVEPSKSALPNPNAALYKEIREIGIPLVFFNAKYEWSDFPYVAMDDTAAGRIVTDHLFDCGHDKISGLFVFDNMQGHKRYLGFTESCLAHGKTDAEQNVMWYAAEDSAKLFIYNKRRILDMLENSTAVVCFNDMLALNLLKFCRENGIRVPDDISVVGIDNSKYAAICDIPLTTAHHPHGRLGEAAAEALLRCMENPELGRHDIIFTPELVVRESVKRL
ncbi:MAG: GntR family transcriptional regulator [Ruminiclostridium sp.]|nr:GntR family transcriptional regulator [Ruminiclostridium sp.]